MRSVPVAAAKFLGNTTAKYRWFALAYLFVCFFLIPLVLMGISFASIAACVTVVVLAILLAVGILALLDKPDHPLFGCGLRVVSNFVGERRCRQCSISWTCFLGNY